MLKMNDDKRFTKNVILMGLSVFILGVKSFVLLAILSKGFGAYFYGIWSQINITITLFSMVAILALEQAIIRFLSGSKSKSKISKEFFSVFLVVSISGFLFSLALFLIAKPLSILVLNDIGSYIYFQAAAILILFLVLNSLSLTYFRAFEKIKKYCLFVFIDSVLQIGLIYLVIRFGYGILGVIGAMGISFLFVLLLQLFFIIRHVSLSIPNFRIMKLYFKFSLPLILTPIFYWILRTGDQYIIGYFLGAAAVGIYSLVYSVSYIIRILSDPIILMLQPAMSRAYNHNNIDQVKKYISYSYKYNFIFAIPAAIGLSILSKSVIGLISGEEFVSGSVLVPIISIGLVVNIFWMILNLTLHLLKKTKIIFLLVFLSTLINVLLNVVFVPLWGILGAAFATLLTFLLLSLVSIILIYVYVKIDLMYGFLFKVILASLIMGIFVYFINNLIGNIFGLVISIIFGVFIYGLLLLIMRCISKSEIDFFIDILRRRN